jgi:enoyl-CoA hydratase
MAAVETEYRADARIAVIVLNRPEVLNALNSEMGRCLSEALTEVSSRRSTRVVVLTGAGDRAFCVGADLKERHGLTTRTWRRQHRVLERAGRQVREFPKPVIAAVNGLALGGGLELAMSADFIIASSNARFGQPEVTRGIIPGLGGTQLLPRYLPPGLASRLLFTGETLSATDARRSGLVTEVCASGSLLARAEDVAEVVAANSPAAIEQVKRALQLGLGEPLDAGIGIELKCYERMLDHRDRFEGVSAFNEGRKPVFVDD